MTHTPDTGVIIAPRDGDVTILPGSMAKVCLGCFCRVWICKASQQHLVDRPGLSILCVPCFSTIVEPGAKVYWAGDTKKRKPVMTILGRSPKSDVQ